MKKLDPSHSFYTLSSLSHKYKCVNCGAYIKKGDLSCYRCGHIFSELDVNLMVKQHQQNKDENGHHTIYFVIIMLIILGIIILPNI